MDAAQIASIVVAIVGAGGALGVVLAYFKLKPGQGEEIEMSVEQAKVNVAQGTLNVAQGTFSLVTNELEDQFKRMAAQVRELEERLSEQHQATWKLRDDLQGRLDKLAGELRDAMAVKNEVERKNVILQSRVEHLESEVAALKGGKQESEARAVIANERADRTEARAVRTEERADRDEIRADAQEARADRAENGDL